MAIGFGLYDGQNTIRAVSREGDRWASKLMLFSWSTPHQLAGVVCSHEHHCGLGNSGSLVGHTRTGVQQTALFPQSMGTQTLAFDLCLPTGGSFSGGRCTTWRCWWESPLYTGGNLQLASWWWPSCAAATVRCCHHLCLPTVSCAVESRAC